MPKEQEELLTSLARQYLTEAEYRNFVALLSLVKSRDSRLRSIAENELNSMADKIIEAMEKNKGLIPSMGA